MRFCGRYDLETKTSVDVVKWTNHTNSEIFFHHSYLLSVSFHITQLNNKTLLSSSIVHPSQFKRKKSRPDTGQHVCKGCGAVLVKFFTAAVLLLRNYRLHCFHCSTVLEVKILPLRHNFCTYDGQSSSGWELFIDWRHRRSMNYIQKTGQNFVRSFKNSWIIASDG